ncbi:MAG: DUF2207 domain-containing protein, partial [Coriobacteriales bacterium]|nr:DUF2207 domain-containing protein [Coriobacteriales bacterium]
KLIAILLCVLALFVALPNVAFADDDYSLDATRIYATADTDGTLHVIEVRTVDLDGHFHGFFWKIPTDDSELGGISIEVEAAGEVDSQGYLSPYEYSSNSNDTTPGVWTMEERRGETRIDVHYDKYHERPRFYVQYVMTGVLARWEDTGELYWKFVGNQWDRTSHDVQCVVYFKGAPEGATITAGENLRGWLHNRSLIGNIEVPSGVVPAWDDLNDGDPGSLVITMNRVNEGEFAEVRAAFPTEWLANAKLSEGKRLDTILDEEGAWASSSNARFKLVSTIATIEKWGLALLSVATAAVGAYSFISYQRTHRASFDDKYFRDVPSDDHPAVLYYLWKNSVGDGPDFTAALMRLSDDGVIKLEKITSLKKRFGRSPKEQEDWRIELVNDRAARVSDPIDRATLDFVFDYVGAKASKYDNLNERPDNTVLMSDFERVAEREPETYEKHLDEWKEAITHQVDLRDLDEDAHDGIGTPLLVMGGIDLIALFLSAVHLFLFNNSLSMVGMIGAVVIRAAILLAVLVAVFILMGTRPDRSSEAVEINAKLEGLRRWLKDFTRLEEALPTDV